VVGFVDDASFLLQGSLWTAPETWREVLAASRPDAAIGDDVFQVLLVQAADGEDPAALAASIDEATGGATSSLTRDEAVLSLPGTREQNRTFTGLIAVTFVVVGLISALFFALLTIERSRLFAAMKALGVGNRRLVVWSVLQAVLVAAGAFAVGLAVTLPLAAAVPAEVPLRLEPSRAVVTGLVLLATAAVGSGLTIRRITRIDPASAIS
jgi:putative ABC transport system permease protein